MFAFLRAINVGGRRPSKDELIAAVDGPELDDVSTFLASGNVLFESGSSPAELEPLLSDRLEQALGYEVTCFVRTLDELADIVGELPEAGPGEKHQVVFYSRPVSDELRAACADAAGDTDSLRWRERELVWTHVGGMLDSPLNGSWSKLPANVNTVRTARTVTRLVAKFR